MWNFFHVHGQLFTINLLLKWTPGSEPKLLNKGEKKQIIIITRWNRWLEISEYCPGFIFILKDSFSVCPCPWLHKVSFCNSSEDKLSDAVTPNMALLRVSSHSKQMSEIHSTPTPFSLPHREPWLGDMRSGFTRPWAFCVLTLAWGVYISNPVLKSKYYCGLLLDISKKHNDLSLTLSSEVPDVACRFLTAVQTWTRLVAFSSVAEDSAFSTKLCS